MLSQSISQPCCLCGWQMTELDLSVIRWGKISFLSPSRSLTHALFLCCVWVAHSPHDVSPPVKSDSSVHRFLSLFPHPRISSFHDTRPCHFSSPCVITYPIILSLLGANLFFVRCWAHDERLPGIDLLHFYTHTISQYIVLKLVTVSDKTIIELFILAMSWPRDFADYILVPDLSWIAFTTGKTCSGRLLGTTMKTTVVRMMLAVSYSEDPEKERSNLFSVSEFLLGSPTTSLNFVLLSAKILNMSWNAKWF